MPLRELEVVRQLRNPSDLTLTNIGLAPKEFADEDIAETIKQAALPPSSSNDG